MKQELVFIPIFDTFIKKPQHLSHCFFVILTWRALLCGQLSQIKKRWSTDLFLWIINAPVSFRL